MLKFVRYALDRLYLRLKPPSENRQVGAIPYWQEGDQVAFLLITSRRSGRWIYPKGSKMKGVADWEAATIEALEEAGVEGTTETIPLGSYRTVKKGFRRSVVEVDMYALNVKVQHGEWEEKGARHRHWAMLPEAKRLLSDPVLVDMTIKLHRRLTREPTPTQTGAEQSSQPQPAPKQAQ